jgi:hypothetical protein
MKSWYYADNGQPYGPFQDNDIRELIKSALLTPDTLVWSDGPGDAELGWVRAAETELYSLFNDGIPQVPNAPQAPKAPSSSAYQSNFYEYKPEQRQFEREEKPKFHYVKYSVPILLFVVIVFALAAINRAVRHPSTRQQATVGAIMTKPENATATPIATNSPPANKPTDKTASDKTVKSWKTETFGGITFKVDSSWDKKPNNEDDGYWYYPPSGLFQVSRNNGVGELELTEESANVFIKGFLGSMGNAQEISHSIVKIGDKKALILSAYGNISEERYRFDTVKESLNKSSI